MISNGGGTDGDARAQSPLVGNILFVAIAIIVGTMVMVFSLTFLDGLQPTQPEVSTKATVTDGEIRIRHQAGEALDTAALEVIVDTPSDRTRVPFSQGTVTGSDSSFGAGERWRYCQVASPGTAVETTLVHIPSNSVLSRVDQSAVETEKTGLEYRCGSAVRLIGRNGGYVSFNMTNYADETIEITGMEISSDSDATQLEGQNSSGRDHTDIYIDNSGGEFTFSPNSPGKDGIAYSSPSAGPFDIDNSPEKIDLTASPNVYFSTAIIGAGNTTRFSLYQFQTSTGDPADMRSAELQLTLYFADRDPRTYSMILPQQRSE